MSAPLNELTWMTLTAGPDTLPEHQQYAGRVIGVPAGTNVGSGPTSPGKILGVYGYPVAAPQGSLIPMNWVLTSSLPGDARAYIHNIPDTGWVLSNAETAFQDQARALIEFGAPMAEVGNLITALWQAAVMNERAAP